MRESRTLLLILPGLFWPPWPLLPVPNAKPPVSIHSSTYPSSRRTMARKRTKPTTQREQVTKNSNYVLQWSTTDETGARGALRPQDTTIRTVQPEEKNDRDTLMRRQSEPGTQRDIWICILCTHSYTYTLTQTGYLKASKCTGVFTSKTREAPATVCLVTQ